MTQRHRIAAYVDAIRPRPGDTPRMTFGDREALDLAEELVTDGATLRFPDALQAAIPALRAFFAETAPDASDSVALLAYAERLKRAVPAFWDAFEGEEVDGVTIIRRRA